MTNSLTKQRLQALNYSGCELARRVNLPLATRIAIAQALARKDRASLSHLPSWLACVAVGIEPRRYAEDLTTSTVQEHLAKTRLRIWRRGDRRLR
jgi:hypothetical protein